MLKVKFGSLNEASVVQPLFAVVMAKYGDGWLFARHKDRTTWEIPGGHREEGEPIENTAERELHEETGAIAPFIVPIQTYSVENDGVTTYGVLFYAEVASLGDLPDFEIAEVHCFNNLPENLTYPDIQPVLFKKGCDYALAWAYTKQDLIAGECCHAGI